MTDVQTWHYGIVAKHWAENNLDGPEIAFFQEQIERYGTPALDAGCGTGRILIPLLKVGLDVDGCDVSPDMLAYCKQRAEAEGLSLNLYQSALHEIDLPRQFQTIFACGVFGLGVSRSQDFIALQRFYDQLLPGGVLLLENYLPYSDKDDWKLWIEDGRKDLPKPWPDTIGAIPDDGADSQMHHRLVSFDPLEQRLVHEMRLLEFKEGELVGDITHPLVNNFYFRNELRALLEKAGFIIEQELGDWTNEPATASTKVIIFVARK